MIIEKINELHKILSLSSQDELDIIGIGHPIDLKTVKKYIQGGKWSILHYDAAANTIGTYGIRVIPYLHSNDWPTMLTMPYMESGIEFPTMKDMVYGQDANILCENSDYFEDALKDWEKIYSVLLPIYQLFGGDDDLEKLKKIIFSPNPPPNNISEEEIFVRRKRLSLEMDSSDENKYLWDLIDKLEDPDFLPDLPTIDLGIYDERIRSVIAFRAYLLSFESSFDDILILLMQIVCYAHGFGSENSKLYYKALPIKTNLVVFSPLNYIFSKEITSNEIKAMPEFHIAEAMYKQQGSYNGIAHMEVATLMDEKYNDPKKAWKYLEASGYWVGKNMPEAQGTVLKAAIHLCEKHGWDEAVEVLKYNQSILES